MKRFISKFFLYSSLLFLVLEIGCRFYLDPLYFYNINTYEKKHGQVGLSYRLNCFLGHTPHTKHVDYLFIGSSRVPCTINPDVIENLDKGSSVVVAGRGYSTPGTHYQALVDRLRRYPNYLKDANVFIEYPGSDVYTTDFKKDKLKIHTGQEGVTEAMPHLILPYLNTSDLPELLSNKNNSLQIRLKIFFLYASSLYRNSFFIQEQFHKRNKPLFSVKEKLLTSAGGVKNENLEGARNKAAERAKEAKNKIENQPYLRYQDLNQSSLNQFHQLVTKNGGKLLLYEIPIHSVQKNIYSGPKAKKNKDIFEAWLKEKNIKIIHTPEFKYEDADFPDTWHLRNKRTDEFTSTLYKNYIKATSNP